MSSKPRSQKTKWLPPLVTAEVSMGQSNRQLLEANPALPNRTLELIIHHDLTTLERNGLCEVWDIKPTGNAYNDTKRLMNVLENEPKKMLSLLVLIASYLVIYIVPVMLPKILNFFISSTYLKILTWTLEKLANYNFFTEAFKIVVLKDAYTNIFKDNKYKYRKIKSTASVINTALLRKINELGGIAPAPSVVILGGASDAPNKPLMDWFKSRILPILKGTWIKPYLMQSFRTSFRRKQPSVSMSKTRSNKARKDSS